ncbi:ribosome biogenesis GTP-binding protein YihA/YsxC ['Crotalaria aegyptiaca' phytoplasma]|uniref:Probable GTP-binding protein EngB n=1 Tax=Candidatus Phytoplasma crotalariae TaxID=2982627 RepID=A0ABT9D3M3_9MOLU|nr:ribosome biogenesis GTP-binding protein YihA/YsxC ['Crotalaria aegyptiaca' phytoplasma]MDO8059190.1 ribosome biogenesis GTP-binding protein YihA/YsxC ['Crotalaria aegyptiaca' phytoplasma]
MNIIKKAIFIKSITNLKYRPLLNFPEFLLIGRSNVGKSSLINALTNHKKLALFSKIPGKTITLNYFLINNSFYLIDSPGYGFSKRNKAERTKQMLMLNHFITYNNQLKMIFQIIDFNIGPTLLDLQMCKNFVKYKIPIVIILNKKDKVKKNHLLSRIKFVRQCFNNNFFNIKDFYLCSCRDKYGISEIISFMIKNLHV